MWKNYIIKFYNPFTYTDYTTQIVEFESSNLLNAQSTCKITLSDNLWFTIQKFDRFQLIKPSNWQDIILFEWYVENITATIWTLVIDWKWLRELLQYKLVLEDKIYTLQTPEAIIQDLLFTWNSNTFWSIWLDVVDLPLDYVVTIEVKNWESIYSVLDRLSKLSLSFVFTMTFWSIVVISQLAWTDRTQNNSDFVRFVYNKEDKLSNNITNPTSTSTDKYNIIIWQNKVVENDRYALMDDTPSFESIWLYFMYENWYIEWSPIPVGQAQIWLLLDTYKQEVRILDLSIIQNLTILLELGDKVSVSIENCWPYLDFIWDWYIIWKNIDLINWAENITYKFWGTILQKIPNLIQQLQELKWWINTQKDLKTTNQAKPQLLN